MGGQPAYDQCGRDFNPPMEHYWGGFAADPPIGSQHMPGDVYFNTASKTMKVVSPDHQTWISVGPPKVGDDFTNALLDEYKWTKGVAGTGTVLILVGDGEVDGAVRLRDSGAAGDNHAQISLGTNRCIQKARLSMYRAKVKISDIAVLHGARARIVLHKAGAFGAVGDYFGFEFDAGVLANWVLRSASAGALPVNGNTGVPVAAGVYCTLTIVINALGIAYVYIDDVLITTIVAANLTVQQLEVLCYVDDNGTSNVIDLTIDYVYVYQ